MILDKDMTCALSQLWLVLHQCDGPIQWGFPSWHNSSIRDRFDLMAEWESFVLLVHKRGESYIWGRECHTWGRDVV